MNKICFLFLLWPAVFHPAPALTGSSPQEASVPQQAPVQQEAGIPGPADPRTYLDSLKAELKKEWPHNRTINLVFHGHSVPSGYFKTPEVRTLDAYPYLVLEKLKARYPHAVINVIVTAIGGENSVQGARRFREDVLTHRPDVLFIDYALNDRRPGVEAAGEAWKAMIAEALANDIKVILLTPSPDQRVDISKPGNELDVFTQMIKDLSAKYGTGLADSYGQFKKLVLEGKDLNDFMSQVNHPNRKGHELIADQLMNYFE